MTSVLTRPTETRPWGAFQNLFAGDGFLVKLIEIAPGHRLSLQRHFEREERWVIVRGTASVEIGGESRVIRAGGTVAVAKQETHRVANAGLQPLLILELQNGSCREDDIERIEDDYRRATEKAS